MKLFTANTWSPAFWYFGKEIGGAARGWNRLIALGGVFFAASLAAFAPEHFYGGPEYIQTMAPSWMPARPFWPYLVGCALLAAATSLAVGKFVRLSSTLLGLMFFLFVCMIYLPSLLSHLNNRMAWIFSSTRSVFRRGCVDSRRKPLARRRSAAIEWMILFGRIVIAVAAVFFAEQHFLHPEFALRRTVVQGNARLGSFAPPFWAYLAGAILLVAGGALLINKNARLAAAVIGLLMTILTLLLYLPILVMASQSPQILEAINYVADTLLFAGAALLVAGALPEDAPLIRGSGARA